MDIFANERRDEICLMLKRDNAVTTSSLVQHFGVSIETIRKDLLVLEQMGRLDRVHGGAVAKNDMQTFHNLQERNMEYIEQKNILSLKATEFICEGDIISVDSGSTAISFAEVLKENFSRLTVVTHSRDVLDILGNHRDFEIILCGGRFMRDENAFYGSATLDMLRSLHTQKAFVFPSSVSIMYGIGAFQGDLLQVEKQLIVSSEEVYVLADSSKFEKKGIV